MPVLTTWSKNTDRKKKNFYFLGRSNTVDAINICIAFGSNQQKLHLGLKVQKSRCNTEGVSQANSSAVLCVQHLGEQRVARQISQKVALVQVLLNLQANTAYFR